MDIIPAIDLKAGQCVRLYQGDMAQATVYADDPVGVARRWQAAGAERLHVVDLDAAVSGAGVNTDAVARICRALDIPVQLGGGLRSLAAIERVFSLGVQRAILGTVAYRQPEVVAEACERFPGRITVGIDARDGKGAVQGWTQATGLAATELAEQCQARGVGEIVYTDIARDGTGQGVNIEATRTLARALEIPVIASGGVASLRDVELLLAGEADGIRGLIIGRALYTGAVDLAEAIRLGRRSAGSQKSKGKGQS